MIAHLLFALLAQSPPVEPERAVAPRQGEPVEVDPDRAAPPEAGAAPSPPVLPPELDPRRQHPGPGGAERDQAREEMIRLFGEVETRLRQIDELLYEASAGEAGLAGAEETSISMLLDNTESRSDEVLQRIDRILEIAQQMGGGQGSSGQQQQSEQQSQGQSPLDQQPNSQGQREATPQVGEQPGEKPENQQSKPEQNQPNSPQDGKQPDSPRESAAEPNNRDAESQPPGSETGRVQVTDTAERWGDLPVHVRDLFRSEGGREMPTEYRDWIDSYYRRLNRRP